MKSVKSKIYSHFLKKEIVLLVTHQMSTIFHMVYDKHIVHMIAYGNNCKIT